MISVLSREQIRALDGHAIEACRVPGLVLMENAGRGAADLIAERAASRPGIVAIVCGAGNNGGDGFVVARRLLTRGVPVRVVFTSTRERLTGDALANYDACLGVGVGVVAITERQLEAANNDLESTLSTAAILVDALFGTGLDREVKGLYALVIARMNAAPGLRIALDIPSGLDANTGCPLGVAVHADETVTFAHPKLGLLTSIGAEYSGRVTVVDIGVPASLADAVGTSARLLQDSDVSSWLARRKVSTHKGAAGRVLAVAGSTGKTGAALLVARGALRAGAGLVMIATFPDVADALDRRVLEEMTARIDPVHVEASLREHLAAADAVVVGPGFGLDARARGVIEHVVMHHDGATVVDADALTHFAGRLSQLREAKGRLILTPHPGELGRLLNLSTADIEQDRFGAVAAAVEQSRAVVLLKGARTLVGAPGRLPVVIPAGPPALATAGSGDVLSGITAALLVAIHDPFHAACAAAQVHGLSGDSWVETQGADRGLVAHEIADAVPAVLSRLLPKTPSAVRSLPD